MATDRELSAEAERLVDVLVHCNRKVVFAESCTGGLVSATLTRIPGVSSRLCGSAVVYQVETKAQWLGVSRRLLESPGPVSREVAAEMALRVLERTPQADVSASVTGHLGPDAPPEKDGLVYIACALRNATETSDNSQVRVDEHRLQAAGDGAEAVAGLRLRRLHEAGFLVLNSVRSWLEEQSLKP